MNPAKLIERIRANGANVYYDKGRIEVVNPSRLPEGAADIIRQNSRALADHLSDEADAAERAAIMEIDGGLTRQAAEYMTKLLMSDPSGKPEEWSWFVNEAAKKIEAKLSRH